MSHDNESTFESLKNEAARQRWDLFHRAIAHAKHCNTLAMEEEMEAENKARDSSANGKRERSDTPLSIAR